MVDVNNKNLRNLFELENDTHLFEYSTCDMVPIWMIARYYYFSLLLGKMTGIEYSLRNRKIERGMVKNLLLTSLYNFYHRNKRLNKTILLYSTNRKTILNGLFINRYVDYFCSVFPSKSLVIEQPILSWEWPFPRWNEEVYFDTISRIKGAFWSRISYRKDYAETYNMVEYLAKRCLQLFAIQWNEEQIESSTRYISQLIFSMRYQAGWLEKLITTKTKLIIMVGAGFPYYYFTNRMLKKRGIISVELQHGWFTSNNYMYNYHPSIANDLRIKNGLPNYMITYGKWWNSQANYPVRKVAIGNPWREYCKMNKKNNSISANKIIVVIGVGSKTDEYLELTKNIKNHFRDYNVVFRPHPGEYQKIENILSPKDGISIDMTEELYDILTMAYAVVSEVSTVLFEAIGIVKRIFVWRTEISEFFLNQHPFEEFSSIEELVKLLFHEPNHYYDERVFWEKDWEDRYTEFIRSTGAI